MKESEAWREIASRIEREDFGISGPWLCNCVFFWPDAAQRPALQSRLNLFSPEAGADTENGWWGVDPKDNDARIIACGLLAAMAESEGK